MVNFTAGSVLTASALNTAFNAATINAQTGTSYTFATADAGELVTLSNASGGTATIPANSTWGAATGTIVSVMNVGTAGSFTIGTAAGVTLNAVSGTTVLAPLEAAVIVKLATNTWQMSKADSGPPGLVKITDTTFTTSSAVNINNCFSSTYDNYLIHVFLTAASATDPSVAFYFRASGTDTTTNYYRGGYYNNASTLAFNGTANANVIATSTTNPTNTTFEATIFRPEDAAITFAHYLSSYVANNGTGPQILHGILRQNSTTQFDGFSLVPSSGTISGTLRVYGYKD